MENNKIAGSKLFVHTSVDFRDELEEVGGGFFVLDKCEEIFVRWKWKKMRTEGRRPSLL